MHVSLSSQTTAGRFHTVISFDWTPTTTTLTSQGKLWLSSSSDSDRTKTPSPIRNYKHVCASWSSESTIQQQLVNRQQLRQLTRLVNHFASPSLQQHEVMSTTGKPTQEKCVFWQSKINSNALLFSVGSL